METAMSATTSKPLVEPFFDPVTSTFTYVVYDRPGGRAAIVDPVLDFDPKAGRTATAVADKVSTFVTQQQLDIDWILETHVHADHVSAAQVLKHRHGGRISLGSGVCEVQKAFARIYNLDGTFQADGSQFDHLFGEGETFAIGALQGTVWHVPGHTPADIAYLIGDAVFVGDTLFPPDCGTARVDFPGGCAHALYRSIRRLLSLPPQTRMFVCHDYPPAGRKPTAETSVADQRAHNIHMHDGVDEAAFVAMRTARDRQLSMPVLILPAVQINMRAGNLPPAEANGVAYLKIPVNAF
jgi:glyoxylase-like metal-dependent hydrolase (beta-lactamase superfamily II)